MNRILLTVHKFFPNHKAGTEVLTLKVAQELQRRHYQVAILTADPEDVNKEHQTRLAKNIDELSVYEYENIKIFSLNEQTLLKNHRFANEYYHPYLKTHYQAVFDSFAPDLLHCFHLQNLSTSLIEEANVRKIPVVYSATDFWLICPIVQLRRPDGSNCRGPAPLAANCLTCYTPELIPDKSEFLAALADKYPSVGDKMANLPKPVNALISDGLYLTYTAKKLPGAVAATVQRPEIVKQVANQFSAITVPTKLMQELFVKNGLDADIIHHIHYGIDTQPLKAGQEKTASEDLRIAFIGTLSEHKGPDLLIKAFLQLPSTVKAKLSIYGDPSQFPEYYASLHNLVDDKSEIGKKITFAGTFPNDQIGHIFRQIDVLVVPSRWYENTPLVIQSALAAKTPVIATNLGGMSELIKHEINGLLFEPNNVRSLFDQLTKIIENRKILKQLVDNIKPERTIADMVDQLEKIYALAGKTNDQNF